MTGKLQSNEAMRKDATVAIVTTRHDPQDDRIYFKEALSLSRSMNVVLIAPQPDRDLTWEKGVQYVPIRRRNGALGRLVSVFEAIASVKRLRADFCHLHDLDLSLAVPALRLLTNAKIIYDSHEVFTKDDVAMERLLPKAVAPVAADAVAQVERLLVSVCHYIITAVDPLDCELSKAGVPVETIFNYPSWEACGETATSPVNAPDDSIVLLYQGTMSADRGLFDMLDAMALVTEYEPRAILRLVGLKDEDLKSKVMARTRRLQLEDHIEVHGWIPFETMPAVMNSSVVGLAPLQHTTKYERALPIKLLEYMACGLPVVASDFGLMKEIVMRHGCGVLHDPSNPESLADAILKVLDNPELRTEMGKRGARAVRDHLNWASMENRLLDVYRSLATQTRSR